MPVYEYECEECEKVFEIQQRISDDPLKTCPDCQGNVKKLMSMSSFQLKGSGWYADGYASASAAKNNEAKATTEKAAPACEAKSAGCAGCPAAAAN